MTTDDDLPRRRRPSLLNHAAFRRYLLHLAHETRPTARFTRVSPETYALAEVELRKWAEAFIHAQPSLGRTIKP